RGLAQISFFSSVVSHPPLPGLSTCSLLSFFFFFFNDTATTEIYTLSLHDALPILHCILRDVLDCTADHVVVCVRAVHGHAAAAPDRKSTRLNSSHVEISYAVFCLKKKKKKYKDTSATNITLVQSWAHRA